ncbi:MAG: tRNA (N6-isopentenyl adenosine(37)-C2)-methylthiotransferase MiaB [Candidatus Calescibacterium sp.]|nr:tRNA (N6-isopentenyl adenosine(37)-C2)-methylthiotransferase MiaB [Candidatus Calescibacterium sp.]MCX7971762.1 tRNA (N6-isopentenyl adenosine(37)-C2)-methylthiotransferase MiaB [bacterium]MDW8195368.1 tRNA (N6-isopentenyl adenosine(37)-C2)-methylthiotransferase MiaB [Candidatus Calescibacterium sp.]
MAYLKDYKYFIKTYGCQANEYDSELIAAILEKLGAQPVENEQDADIVVFNTCAVRKNAENKVYGRLGALKKIKNEKKDMIVIVSGCLVQKDYLKISSIDHVDIVLGTHRISALPQILQEIKNSRGKIVDIDFTGRVEPDIPPKRLSKFSAYIPIMFGCDYYCTFCIVPFTRGRMQSRNKEDILKEVRELDNRGYKEITYIGQTVNAYGIDKRYEYDFADLLKETSEIVRSIRWVRFTSPYPSNFTDKQIEVISSTPVIAKHIHLPLQSGNNEILRRMARRYTVEQFKEIVYKFRERNSYIGLSTDIIVGFPGETESQFEDTLKVVEEIRFDQAFMFAYSEREGTKAATYEDRIPYRERLKRLYRLIQLQNSITEEKNREYIGKTVEVLVEGPTDKNPEMWEGRTETNKIVVFKKPDRDISGQFFKFRITSAHLWGLEGEILPD